MQFRGWFFIGHFKKLGGLFDIDLESDIDCLSSVAKVVLGLALR
jgi:hypothetical protein